MGEIEHLLNSSITLEAWTGTFDSYGKPVYSAGVSVPARILKKIKKTNDLEGNEVVSTTQIFCELQTITTKDRITLPSGVQPLIINVSPFDGYSDYHHTEVYT